MSLFETDYENKHLVKIRNILFINCLLFIIKIFVIIAVIKKCYVIEINIYD